MWEKKGFNLVCAEEKGKSLENSEGKKDFYKETYCNSDCAVLLKGTKKK